MSLEVPRTLIAQLQLTNLLLCAVQSKTLLRLFQWRGGQERVLVLWLCNQQPGFSNTFGHKADKGGKYMRRCLEKMKNVCQMRMRGTPVAETDLRRERRDYANRRKCNLQLTKLWVWLKCKPWDKNTTGWPHSSSRHGEREYNSNFAWIQWNNSVAEICLSFSLSFVSIVW